MFRKVEQSGRDQSEAALRRCRRNRQAARGCADLHIFCLNTSLGVVPVRKPAGDREIRSCSIAVPLCAARSCSTMKPNVVPGTGHRQPILLGFCGCDAFQGLCRTNTTLGASGFLGAIIPDLDSVVAAQQENLPTPAKPIMPLYMRLPLLAGIAIVEHAGPEMLRMLRGHIIGDDRVRFTDAAESMISRSRRSNASMQMHLI